MKRLRLRWSSVSVVLVGLTACDVEKSADTDTDAATDTDAEALRECAGAEYPESAVLVADQFGLEVEGTEALAALDGIRCVAGGSLTIRGVTDLFAASALERVESSVIVVDNPELTSVDGLSSLTHVGRSVVVDANPKLANLDGLTGLVSIGSTMKIGVESHPVGDGATAEHGNDALLTLPSFSALIEVGSIVAADNDKLSELGVAPAVTVFTVAFVNNPSLPAADASAWVEMLEGAETVKICGCLNDPNPVCMENGPGGA